MSDTIYYHHAPIEEAIIDLQIEPEKGISFANLEQMHRLLIPEFPHLQRIERREVDLLSDLKPRDEVTLPPFGLRLISSDNRKIVTATLEGFSFSLLSPYTTWEEFSGLARAAWEVFRQCVPISELRRVSVRYINQFNFHETLLPLEKYFTLYPLVPTNIGTPLIAQEMRVAVQVPQLEGLAVIAQSPVLPKFEGGSSLLLDIDLFRVDHVPQEEEALWNLLAQFRKEKNRIFQNCLTSEAESLIT